MWPFAHPSQACFGPRQACGCGSIGPSGCGRLRPEPAVGTVVLRGVVGSIIDSRFGRLPMIKSLISSPLKVSNSSSPLGERFKVGALVGEDLLRLVVTGLDQPPDLGVDLLHGGLGNILLARHRIAEEHFFLVLAIGDGAERVGETPARHHHACELGRLLDVGRSAGSDLLAAEHEFLGDAAAHHDGNREVICSRLIDSLSRSGNCMTMPSARPRGMIVALCTGSVALTLTATMAWPPS